VLGTGNVPAAAVTTFVIEIAGAIYWSREFI
jgi:hypothetical protein